jgi:hypothetical protein
VERHDQAYWLGDWRTVELARRLYREMLPATSELPPLFDRDSPRWVMRVAHYSWNALLKALPPVLRRQLFEKSRGLVEKLKRGRVITGRDAS